MTRLARSFLLIASAVAMTATVATAHDRPRAARPAHAAASSTTLVGVAAANPDFSTLVAAVQAAGLADTLSGSGPFTIFAPNNAAFGTLPDGTVERLVQPRQRAQLTRILTYHVVPGRISASDLATAVRVGGGSAVLSTVEGGRLAAQDAGRGRLRLTDSTGDTFWITATDVNASNGVIHVIDGVLTPGH